MNAIIIYQGKYGATKEYAEWLGEELELPVRPSRIINWEQLDPYDTLLIGTSVYIGKLQIGKWLKRNLEFLGNKKIFFFQVAATPPDQLDKREAYNISGIPPELIGLCGFYYLPGRLSMARLSWVDRLLLKLGARMQKDKKEKERMLTDHDDVKKENLHELITDVNDYFHSKRKALPVMEQVAYD